MAAFSISDAEPKRGRMSEAAVLDKPADATTETTAKDVAETKDAVIDGATDGSELAQTDTGADDTTDTADDDEAHEAQLERERQEAERETIRAEERAKLADEAREEREKAAETARKAKAKTARKDAFDTAVALAEPKDGRLLAYLNPETGAYEVVPAKNLTDIVDGLGLHVEEAVEDQVREKWRVGIERSLPDEASNKAFSAWLSESDRPIHEVIGYLAEQLAPKTAWAKALTLDDAKSMSPALRKEVADLIKSEREDARGQGQRDKGRPPGAKERAAASSNEPSNRREAEEIFAASAKDSAAISRLRAHRRQFAT